MDTPYLADPIRVEAQITVCAPATAKEILAPMAIRIIAKFRIIYKVEQAWLNWCSLTLLNSI